MAEPAIPCLNDNHITTFGRMPGDLDGLDGLLAWLLVEMVRDDADAVIYACDARLVSMVIDQRRPVTRTRPRFTVIE